MTRPRPAGFSYIEVLVVVGLLAILSLTIMPQLGVPDKLQAAQAARQIAADLRRTQELSIAQRAYYTLQFSPAAAPYTSYSVYLAADPTAVQPDFPKTIPPGITVGGRRTFCFATGGWVDDGCGPGLAGTDGSVTVSSGPATSTVWVYWYNGRVQVVGP